MTIEQERFSELTLRLFHTELESVYEEFNRAQDNDGRLVNYALMELLFPNHPNGQQTTLGRPEHLKNPSMKAIHEYFNNFYVPNNMAMILVGDLDFDQTIQAVNDTFGKLKPVDFPEKEEVEEAPLNKIVTKTVKSPAMPRLQMAWRTASFGSKEARLAEVCAQILSNNGEVGLIDINLNQKQKVLRAGAFSYAFKKYGYISLVIIPKENQGFEEAEQLLLDQIDLIKKGDFPEWMLEAVYNDMKLQRLKAWETANGLAMTLYDNFIKDRSWAQELEEMQDFQSITKEDVVDFAQNFFRDNYAVVYKEQGDNENLIRVEQPKITPVKINRTEDSVFFKEIKAMPTTDIKPKFIDYDKEISKTEIAGHEVSYVHNKYSDLAQMNLLFPFGKDNDRYLELAFTLMDYLGTDDRSAEDIKAGFYRLGITQNFQVTKDHISVMISGLEDQMPEAIKLIFHYLQNLKADESTYKEVVATILEARAYNKKDKSKVLNALTNYAKYGPKSRLTDVVTTQELNDLNAEFLVDKIKHLTHYPFEVFYYGKQFELFKNSVSNYLRVATQTPPADKVYDEPKTSGDIYFTEYDMVQTEMMKVGRADVVNPFAFGNVNVFNEYFGRGLSSIVFQELRESRSLAYSAYVSYSASQNLGDHNYVFTYIGTQPDKLNQANEAIDELLENFPLIPPQFENARNTMLKQIASGRINRQNIFFKHYNLKKLGVYHDLRKDIYQQIETMTLEDLHHFFEKEVKSVKFNTALIGKKADIQKNNPSLVKQWKELSLEEIFGY